LSVTVNDVGGSPLVSSKTTVNVTDAALTDTSTAKTVSVPLGSSTGTIVLATFTDANPSAPLSDYTPSVDWGGTLTGTPSASVQLVSRTTTTSTWQVVGNATYATIGTYIVNVTVSDVGGSSLK